MPCTACTALAEVAVVASIKLCKPGIEGDILGERILHLAWFLAEPRFFGEDFCAPAGPDTHVTEKRTKDRRS